MAEKVNTMKDLDQAMIDLGVRLCEDFNNGRVINDAQGKLLDETIKLYSTVKINSNDPTSKMYEVLLKQLEQGKPKEQTENAKSKK